MKILFFLYIFISITFQIYAAQWECTSNAIGDNTFLACGSGTSKELQDAKTKALEAAEREFDNFCNKSYHCKGYETIQTPRRVFCSKKDNDFFQCNRAIEVRILDIKKSDIYINENEVKKKIRDKKEQLKELQEQVSQLAYLKNLDRLIELRKEKLKNIQNDRKLNEMINTKKSIEAIEQKEIEIKALEEAISEESKTNNKYMYTSKDRNWFIEVGMNYLPIPNNHSFHHGLEFKAGIEGKFLKLFKNKFALGLRIEFGVGGELKKDEKTSRTGPPNDILSTRTSILTISYAVGLSLDVMNFYIIPKIGRLHARYERKDTLYSKYGYLYSSEESTEQNAFNYISITLGKRWFIYEHLDWFLETEIRGYSSYKGVRPSMAIGLGYSF